MKGKNPSARIKETKWSGSFPLPGFLEKRLQDMITLLKLGLPDSAKLALATENGGHNR
jgi:hypothetical protein